MALALQAQLSSQKLRQVTIFSRSLLVFPLKSPGKWGPDPKSLEGPLLSSSALEQKAQHSPERLGGAPEQLVSDRKCGEVEAAFFEGKLAQTSDRHLQRAAHRYRSQLAQACLALVRNHSHPRVRLGEYLLDFVHRQIPPEFYGERLAVATHCADAHADAVDRDRVLFAAKNLVAFRLAFPLFAALAVAEILVDPRQQAARERKPELPAWQRSVPQRRGHRPVQLKDRGGRILQQRSRGLVHESGLLDQLTHVVGARAGGSLIGHRGHPFDEVRFQQAVHAHEHQAYGAVSPDVIAYASGKRIPDHVHVDRIQDDDRVVPHAESRCGVYPVALPPRGAQPGKHLVSEVAALTGDDDVHQRKLSYVLRVFERCRFLSDEWPELAHSGSREKHRLNQCEIALGVHALHQHRSDHSAPTDESDSLHRISRMSDLRMLTH